MKISKLLLLCVAVIFLSCSEEEESMPTSKGMLGEWALSSLDYKGTSTTTIESTSFSANFTGTGKDLNLTTTFTENPNEVVSAGSYTIVLKTTFAGQTTTEDVPMEDVVSDGTWSLSGRNLSITTDLDTQTATVVEQTSTTLKLKINLSESDTEQGMTVSTNIQATYTFTKK